MSWYPTARAIGQKMLQAFNTYETGKNIKQEFNDHWKAIKHTVTDAEKYASDAWDEVQAMLSNHPQFVQQSISKGYSFSDIQQKDRKRTAGVVKPSELGSKHPRWEFGDDNTTPKKPRQDNTDLSPLEKKRAFDRAKQAMRLGKEVPKDDVTEMEVDGSGESSVARTAAGGGGSGPGPGATAHETQVSSIPRYVPYGPYLHTFTTVMPFNFKYEAVIANMTSPSVLVLRMNSIYDIIRNVETNQLDKDSLQNDNIINPALNQFGSALAPTATALRSAQVGNALQQPAWRPYFTALYDYYHVCGVEYEIQMRMTTEDKGARAGVFTQYSSETTPPYHGSSLQEMQYWKNLPPIKYFLPRDAACAPLGMMTQSFSGRWQPGTHTHDVRDDEKSKTWTLVGETPKLVEDINIVHNIAPLSQLATNVSLTAYMTVKYLVQFKDLKREYRFPRSTTVGTSLTTPGFAPALGPTPV
jgi:hypothetical protein